LKANPDYKGKWFAPRIDNPEYKGVWAPRKIPNPDFFEDLAPVKSLPKIVCLFSFVYKDFSQRRAKGGVGIELWTMTEDILFNNIYVGHSAEDAKKLAAETFEIKKRLEDKAEAPEETDEDDGEVSLKDDPVGFIRFKVLDFIDHLKEDPIDAFKSKPETGVALLVAIFTIFSMLGGLFGFGGASQKPVVTNVSSIGCSRLVCF